MQNLYWLLPLLELADSDFSIESLCTLSIVSSDSIAFCPYFYFLLSYFVYFRYLRS